MAIRAGFRRGFIEQHRFALNLALEFVAHGAADIGVTARQRKLRALVVIESRGRPALVYMAIRAFRDPVFGGELAAVRIGVARLAILRRSLELNFVRIR